MDTGIYYLYEHKNRQKLRNTGFMKITRQENSCILQFNARTIPVTQQDTAMLSAFYIENDSANTAHLSDIPCGNQMISGKITAAESLFPSQYPLNRIDGFFLTLPHGEILAVTAPNAEFDTQKIVFLSDKTRTETAKSSGVSNSPDTEPELQTEAHSDMPDSKLQTDALSDMPNPELQADALSDMPDSEPKQSSEPKSSARKIQRSELSSLPRRYWNLANNSFLLHGYYNYNHLLLVEEDGHYWLGVPGIYDPRESRAAELFGFSQFTDSYNQQLALADDECCNYGRFGYWCRYLK